MPTPDTDRTLANPPMGRRLVRLAIGLSISAGFVALAALSMKRSGVTFEEVLNRLRLGDYRLVALYALILLVLLAVRVARWGLLVRGIGAVGWRRIVAVGAVGQMSIALFPMRVGEAVRPWLISESDQISFSQATATVVVERVVDGLVISVMFIATLLFLRSMELPSEFMLGAKATAAIFGAAAAMLLVAALIRNRTKRLVGRLITPIAPRVGSFVISAIDHFFDAIRTLVRQPRRGGAYLAVTAALWILNGLSLLPVFWAFGQDLPVVASFTVLCVMVLGFMIPAGPAATGTYNYAIILSLNAFLADDSVIGALAILLHLILIALNVVVGLVGLWMGGFTLRSLIRPARRVTAEVTGGEH